MKKIVMFLVLCIGSATASKAHALRCELVNPLTGQCTSTAPDLLPSGRDVANNYSPASNEVVICTAINYQNWCQALDANQFPDVPNLTPSGWYGAFYVRSYKVGSRAQGELCPQTNYGGSCIALNNGTSSSNTPASWQSLAFWRN